MRSWSDIVARPRHVRIRNWTVLPVCAGACECRLGGDRRVSCNQRQGHTRGIPAVDIGG